MSERPPRRRVLHIDEADRAELAVRGERGARSHPSALGGGSDEQRVHARGGRRLQARHHAIDGQALRDDPRPHRQDRDEIMHQDRAEATGPDGRPEWQRRGQGARREQPGRVASPIAGPITAGDQQTEEQSYRKLPAVEVATGESGAERVAQRIAGDPALPYRSDRGTQDGERRHVRGHEDDEA